MELEALDNASGVLQTPRWRRSRGPCAQGWEGWKRVKRVEARAPSGWTRTGPARGRPLAGPRSRPPAASK